MRVARVLVDSTLPQLDRLLDYLIPDSLANSEQIVPGVRVQVPLRSARRLATGYVVEIATEPEFPGPISDVAALVSPVPVLRPEVWRLARRVADRAAGSANDVLRLAIPRRQVRVESAWLARSDTPEASVPRARPLAGYGAADGYLLENGARIALQAHPGVVRVAESTWVGRWAVTLVEAASQQLAAGRSAILVAPDQRDQEQLLAAAGSLLPPAAILRWDARQTAPDRYRALLRASEEAVVIIGARSAVYLPATQLGLVAVWNDGDPLLAEPLAPYVHVRDAALIRCEQQGAALIFAGHTRTAEIERLVEIGWLEGLAPAREDRPRVIVTENMAGDEPLAALARIPSFAWRTARDALRAGPVLVQVSRPGTEGAGADRTAHDLGRAFPGVPVVVSDGERHVVAVDERSQLVVATRGAEPIAAGGYHAVLLLDGDRMLMREALRVAEDCLRWWADATSLARDDSPIVLVGVSGRLATTLATWRHVEFARAELADRRALRYPPAVRTATLEGFPDSLDSALERIRAAHPEIEPVTPIEPDGHEPGRVRTVIRFDYALGNAVAEAVRAEIIRQATSRRKPIPGRPASGRQQLPFRARFDDGAPFDDARGLRRGRIEG